MRRVSVPVLKAFVTDGRDVSPGEIIAMSPIEAAVAARHGYVSLTRQTYRTRHLEAAAVAVAEPPRRRRGRPRKVKDPA